MNACTHVNQTKFISRNTTDTTDTTDNELQNGEQHHNVLDPAIVTFQTSHDAGLISGHHDGNKRNTETPIN